MTHRISTLTVTLPRLLLLTLSVVIISARPAAAQNGDDALVHYTFDTNTGDVAKDQGFHGNDGKLTSAEYIAEVDGHKGVMRFDGNKAVLDLPDTDATRINGDMTFEMWVRLNGPATKDWATIFGDSTNFAFYLASRVQPVLWYDTIDPLQNNESAPIPVDRDFLSDHWTHIAMVVEYPRCKFYRDGILVRDSYMPLPGILDQHHGIKQIGKACPIDVDEFRLYRRALTGAEIAAHRNGEELAPQPACDLVVEPNWYDNKLTLRLSCKATGGKTGQLAKLTVLNSDGATAVSAKDVPLTKAFPDSDRLVATAEFSLLPLAGLSVNATARVPAGGERTVVTHALLTKPRWIHSQEGYSDRVLAPWTAVKTSKPADSAVQVEMWNRKYEFGRTPLFGQIITGDVELLAAPISLTGKADGTPLTWSDAQVQLGDATETAADVEQRFNNDRAMLHIAAHTEYDGYTIFDCTIQAKRDLDLSEVTLDIPLKSLYAKLCYGDRVYPPDNKVEMNEWQRGAVTGDMAMRFSPCIWLGDGQRGVVWQAESDQDWHYADAQHAIEVLPRDETTVFRAHFIDVPTKLATGKSLHYKFALQATPIKPMLRDSWDLRIMRSEPYGADLDLPDKQAADGKPFLRCYHEMGIRNLFINVGDMWPYPLPMHNQFALALHRVIDQAHANGIQIYDYLLHERFPTAAPEFDGYGLNMAMRPMRQYIYIGPPPGSARPGPITYKYGADLNGTVFMCPQSMALQDAYIDSLARRLDEYGEDGVYLDGTSQCPPCSNLEHGCGYIDASGKLHKTYPVFAVRDFMRRVYTIVKQRKPDGVVDDHCSFGWNPSAMAYSDVYWTGEQWYHLRHTGSKFIPDDLPLDMFRTEFMGYQIGVPAEMITYRLGAGQHDPSMKVAAITLLHDVTPRPSTWNPDIQTKPDDMSYYELMPRIWAMRDRFDAGHAKKLFYWENQKYVQVSPEHVYATLLEHPTNGVLALISNLGREKQTVNVQFNFDALGLAGRHVTASNALTDQPITLGLNGELSVDLDSVQWIYVWLKPGK